MGAVDPAHVLNTLSELKRWADYIVESLTLDQPFEKGKISLLKELVGEGPFETFAS